MLQKPKAILIGVDCDNQMNFKNSMEELSRLAEACDIEVVGLISQKSSRASKSRYIGTGKIQEVFELVSEKNADLIISNDELSASQISNLEEDLNCEIIDRTVLILNIFAQRAKTREAKLQVEIAQLYYQLPRLIGLRESLGRQRGGTGFYNRGSGETKLELDRRRIESRISALNNELKALVLDRQNQRKKRKKTEVPVVALVGYTNSGKSTIMNAMLDMYQSPTDKKVFEKDMLFATLETSVRRIGMTANKSFLLTDTVGFISKLPHQLVKAFRSTLEEVSEADVIIHVVDYSNPNYKHQIEVTQETLKEIGVNNIPVIYAYNKIDLLDDNISRIEEDRVYIAAKKKDGIDKLVYAIQQSAFPVYINCEMLIPYDKGSIVSYLNDNADIKSTEYLEDGILMSLECKQADYEKFKQYSKQISLYS